MSDPAPKPAFNLSHWLQDKAARAAIGLMLALPYGPRVRLGGWVMAHLVAPLAGWPRRIRRNLALALPDLPKAEVAWLVRAVPDNVGRTLIEIYSGPEFVTRAAARPLTGPGVAALEAARRDGRPVIIVTGHFGNYDAARAGLIARGYPVGGLYKPMKNRYFDAHYVRAIRRIGEPLFPRGREGLADMVRHLRGGGFLGMVIDQHMKHGARLAFFGHPANTALSAAELALRYQALLVPIYARRLPDGLDFEIIVEDPIPAASPEAMTQALNDSLEILVRQYPEQWFWIHRRWKALFPKRKRR